jgi:hypothetical protein
LDFGSLKKLEGQFGLLDQTYIRVGGRTLIFLVWTYTRGPLDVLLQIVYGHMLGTTLMYATFQNTPWIILGHTLQLLDHCVNSIRLTLRLPNVCYFSGELVAPLSYKYPQAPLFSHTLFHCSRHPQVASTFVIVFCEVCELLRNQRGGSCSFVLRR